MQEGLGRRREGRREVGGSSEPLPQVCFVQQAPWAFRYLGSWTRPGCAYHYWDPRYLRTPGVKIGHELQHFELPTSKNRIAVAASETYHSATQDHSPSTRILQPPCSARLWCLLTTVLLFQKGIPKKSLTDAQWHHRKPQSLRLQRLLQWRPASSVQMHPQQTTSDALFS